MCDVRASFIVSFCSLLFSSWFFFFVIYSFTLWPLLVRPFFLHLFRSDYRPSFTSFPFRCFQNFLLLFWLHSLPVLFFPSFMVCVRASWCRFAFSLNIKKFCSFHWPKRSNNFILSTTTIPSNRGKSKANVFACCTVLANKLRTHTRARIKQR